MAEHNKRILFLFLFNKLFDNAEYGLSHYLYQNDKVFAVYKTNETRDDGQISGISFCKQTEFCTPSEWSSILFGKLMVTHLDKHENCNQVHYSLPLDRIPRELNPMFFFLNQCPHMSLWTSWSSLLGMAEM